VQIDPTDTVAAPLLALIKHQFHTPTCQRVYV
jgi:hypothetical protein